MDEISRKDDSDSSKRLAQCVDRNLPFDSLVEKT